MCNLSPNLPVPIGGVDFEISQSETHQFEASQNKLLGVSQVSEASEKPKESEASEASEGQSERKKVLP